MAKIQKKSINGERPETNVPRVQRAWGCEYWLVNNDQYCGKVLYVEKGKATSLHFHMKKHETMLLEHGSVTLKMIDPETGDQYDIDMQPGDCVEIPPGQPHRILANETSFVHEFSTTHFEEDSRRCAPRIA